MCLSFFHKMKLLAKSFAALAAGIFLFSCKPTDLIRSGELPPIWPDYVNVTIPANIAPLNFGPTDSLKVKGMRVEKPRNICSGHRHVLNMTIPGLSTLRRITIWVISTG